MPWFEGWGFWYESPDGDVNHATRTSSTNPMFGIITPLASPSNPVTASAAAPVAPGNAAQPTLTDLQKLNLQQQEDAKAESDRSAKTAINATLAIYGLESLGNWAWQQYLADVPVEQIMLDMRQRPEYKQRFPAMETLAKSGRAISESEYIDYERGAVALMQAAGLPEGFYDRPDDFDQFLTNGVALPELQSRIDIAKAAVYNSDPATLSALQQFYGVQGGLAHIGAATAYFLDPDRALPAIEKQWISAQEAGAAIRAGYQGLSQSYAEHLADLGIDPNKAGEGFGTLANLDPLFANLPGEAGGVPTQQQGLQAMFENNAEGQQAITAVQARRKAVFGGGGGFAQTEEGITGL